MQPEESKNMNARKLNKTINKIIDHETEQK